MFGRVSTQSLRRGYGTIRDHIYRGYGQARLFASHFDSAVELGARTYRALQPVLRDIAPDTEKRVTSVATGLKSDYNELRKRAMDANDTMTSVGAQLRRKVPELGL